MARSRNDFLDVRLGTAPAMRCCDQPGCASEALFRAPRSRDQLGELGDYHWFCLEHVRSYNAAWNYYAGMNETEIESELRRDLVGRRPTWPLGWRVGDRRWRDPLRLFEDQAEFRPDRTRRRKTEEEEALEVFDLRPPFSKNELRTRYKILVKRHHPDTHGGSKEAEERLKIITRAYAFLKQRYLG